MAKRPKPIADDLTLAGMPLEEEEAPRRRRKATAEAPRVDPWYLVACECPCKANAESHHLPTNGVVRVHVQAMGSPILCVPGHVVGARHVPTDMPLGPSEPAKEWDVPLYYPYRITPAYSLAELTGNNVTPGSQ